jgi:hypothetical protein
MLQVDLDFLWFYWGDQTACFQVTTTYNWIFPIKSWSGSGSWNWYAGVGVGGGMWWNSKEAGFLGAAGVIGVEYNFKFPLQLALEYRPIIGSWISSYRDTEWKTIRYYAGFNYFGLCGGGLAIRYKF